MMSVGDERSSLDATNANNLGDVSPNYYKSNQINRVRTQPVEPKQVTDDDALLGEYTVTIVLSV